MRTNYFNFFGMRKKYFNFKICSNYNMDNSFVPDDVFEFFSSFEAISLAFAAALANRRHRYTHFGLGGLAPKSFSKPCYTPLSIQNPRKVYLGFSLCNVRWYDAPIHKH